MSRLGNRDIFIPNRRVPNQLSALIWKLENQYEAADGLVIT